MLSPLSEVNKKVRPSSLIFYRLPLDPLPTANLGIVALNLAAFHALAADSIVAQQSPDVSRMGSEPGQLLDKTGHTRRRPQVGFVLAEHRAGDKRLHDLVGLSKCGPAFPLLAEPAWPPHSDADFHR